MTILTIFVAYTQSLGEHDFAYILPLRFYFVNTFDFILHSMQHLHSIQFPKIKIPPGKPAGRLIDYLFALISLIIDSKFCEK